jgi:hypothetical protein
VSPHNFNSRAAHVVEMVTLYLLGVAGLDHRRAGTEGSVRTSGPPVKV